MPSLRQDIFSVLLVAAVVLAPSAAAAQEIIISLPDDIEVEEETTPTEEPESQESPPPPPTRTQPNQQTAPQQRPQQQAIVPQSDILVQDGILLGDWQMRRADLDTAVAEMRTAVRDGGLHDVMGAASEFMETLERFSEYGSVIMAEQTEEIDSLLARLDRLVQNYIVDWETGNQLQLMNTLRLIEGSTARLEEMAQIDDLRNERVRGPFLAGMPLDWGPPKYPDESMRLGLSTMSAEEVYDRIQLRTRSLRRSAALRRIPSGDAAVVHEVGELGRALVLRQNEFPELMRPAFRNAALRIDVIAENMADFLEDGDRAAYRRQLLELERALERVREFYTLRDRTARDRIRSND